MIELIEVRRDDSELCGYVAEQSNETDRATWRALTVFGGLLGERDDEASATNLVLERGLSSLADRWELHNLENGTEEVVLIVEASPGAVTVAVGYFAGPGVPNLRFSVADITSGPWRLTLR